MPKNKNKQSLQGRECFIRMNFLYQAAMLVSGQNNVLSAYYGQLCRNVGKKCTLRIEPNIKRDFCKRCSLALKPGINSYLDARNSNNLNNKQIVEEIQHTCNLCGYKKRLQINPNYPFWLENPNSIAAIYNSVDNIKQQKH